MPARKHPLFVYARVLEPWNQVAIRAPSVIGLRLWLLPWLWWHNPLKASEEVQRMISEKNSAWQETSFALAQAPMRFWLDAMAATVSNDPIKAFYQAMVSSSRRVAQPTGSRVKANLKNLTTP